MADPPKRPGRAGGFTLVEMLVAMGILVFGITSLIGLLGLGVSTRRTSELRNQSVYAVDEVIHHVREHVLPRQTFDEDDVPVPLEPVTLDPVEGYPRLRARVDFHYDESYPHLVLLDVHLTWLEEGAVVGERFRRVLPSYDGFSRRVGRVRSKQ